MRRRVRGTKCRQPPVGQPPAGAGHPEPAGERTEPRLPVGRQGCQAQQRDPRRATAHHLPGRDDRGHRDTGTGRQDEPGRRAADGAHQRHRARPQEPHPPDGREQHVRRTARPAPDAVVPAVQRDADRVAGAEHQGEPAGEEGGDQRWRGRGGRQRQGEGPSQSRRSPKAPHRRQVDRAQGLVGARAGSGEGIRAGRRSGERTRHRLGGCRRTRRFRDRSRRRFRLRREPPDVGVAAGQSRVGRLLRDVVRHVV